MSVFRRLFKEHFLLTFLLGITWILIVAVAVSGPEDPRHPNIGSLLLFWTIPVILISFAWMNSGHYQQLESKIKKRVFTWGSAFADFFVFAVLFSIPAIVLAPAYGNYAVRSKMNNMIISVGKLQAEIAEIAQDSGELSSAAAELTIGKPENADFAFLSPDGTIVLYNERYGAFAAIMPVMNNGTVKWRCQGFPAALFPMSCRGDNR